MADMTAEALDARMIECHIPDYMRLGLREYILNGRPVGHFLTAVLNNDLKGACNRADEVNQKSLYQYVFFLYNYAPRECWGRPGATDAWQEGGGYNGLARALLAASSGRSLTEFATDVQSLRQPEKKESK